MRLMASGDSQLLLEKEKPIAGGSQYGSSYRSGSTYEPASMTNSGSFSSTLIVKKSEEPESYEEVAKWFNNNKDE